MVKKSLEVEGMNPLISPEQLAALLGIGTEQVRKLTRDNLIPHHRVGGLLRYDYEAVKAATRQGGEIDQVETGRRHLARIVETESMRLPQERNANRSVYCVILMATLLKDLGIYDQKMMGNAIIDGANAINKLQKVPAHE